MKRFYAFIWQIFYRSRHVRKFHRGTWRIGCHETTQSYCTVSQSSNPATETQRYGRGELNDGKTKHGKWSSLVVTVSVGYQIGLIVVASRGRRRVTAEDESTRGIAAKDLLVALVQSSANELEPFIYEALEVGITSHDGDAVEPSRFSTANLEPAHQFSSRIHTKASTVNRVDAFWSNGNR